MARLFAEFWEKVEAVPDLHSCWNWLGGLDKDGYGQFHEPDKTVSRRAHKWFWTYIHGPVDENKELDHSCRNKRCVNPAHLEVVTHRINIQRKELPKEYKLKSHCDSGHEFTEENTGHTVDQYGYRKRYCRECGRIRNRESRAKKWRDTQAKNL